MPHERPLPLLVGEVSVDVTVTPRGHEQKLRMGGIAHAARGFWASGAPFAAGMVLPSYLERSAKQYLAKLGCAEFFTLGTVSGAPNVTLIFDPTEVDDQEYDTLLRDEKIVQVNAELGAGDLTKFMDVLIFPGSFDLRELCKLLSPQAQLHMDIAYDVENIDTLRGLNLRIATILISTSSKLFSKIGSSGIAELSSNLAPLGLDTVILKENRGGSRLRIYSNKQTHDGSAQLSSTVNSVGVGDVFAATYLTNLEKGPLEAAWRATYASSAYAQTTYPDVFRSMIQRDAQLTLDEMIGLAGTALPWETRKASHIYLAAPDFAGVDRGAIERAVSSLQYHNFRVRRPVQENGELPPGSDSFALGRTYRKDVEIIEGMQTALCCANRQRPGNARGDRTRNCRSDARRSV